MRRIVAAWRRGGIGRAARTVWSRWNDRRIERRSGADTAGLIPIETLVEDWRGCHDYFPTPYAELKTMLASLRPGPDDVFVDIGAGKGRALAIAAGFPFARIVGVEISPSLCASARELVARASGGFVCRNIEIVEADAGAFAIPADATFLYLYNPFHGARLEALFDAIGASLADHPRRLTIIYNNPAHFEPIESRFPWLSRARVMELEYRWIVYAAGSPNKAGESDVPKP
jgi:SAM-dependent methyltransferase